RLVQQQLMRARTRQWSLPPPMRAARMVAIASVGVRGYLFATPKLGEAPLRPRPRAQKRITSLATLWLPKTLSSQDATEWRSRAKGAPSWGTMAFSSRTGRAEMRGHA